MSHNRLEVLDLSWTRTNNLRALDLSHNSLKQLDIGSGLFNQLRLLNMSHNAIHTYHVDNRIRLQFKKLRILDLSHNKISGMVLRSEIDVFKRNVTIDLSSNLISRLDMRRTSRDVMLDEKTFFSGSYKTTYKLNDNQIICDCYAGMLNSTYSENENGTQGAVFEPFKCEDGHLVDVESSETLSCPVPDFYGMESFLSCPNDCACSYSILGARALVNCSSRGLKQFPDVGQFPRLTSSDDEVILLVANNQIEQMKARRYIKERVKQTMTKPSCNLFDI